jgi:hypothetical protein
MLTYADVCGRMLTLLLRSASKKDAIEICMQVAHTYVSSFYYICVLILLCMCPLDAVELSMQVAHTYVSSFYNMCPHTTIYVSS